CRFNSKQEVPPGQTPPLFKTPFENVFISSPLENALAKIGIVDAQKIAAGSIKRSRRPEVVAIILVQLPARMKSDLINHSREIAHSLRHFFWAFWIGRHSRVIAVSLYSCNSSG